MAAQAKAGGVTPVADRAADGGLGKTQEFFRLFLAPGMGHCAGGPGPNQLGQTGGDGDADHDIVAALERWVEKGEAPARIVATKFTDNDPAKPAEMTRPLCPFPQAAKYKGSGDTNDAANFACAAP